MVDLNSCGWVTPHLPHNWDYQSPYPYGHRAYYYCPGVPLDLDMDQGGDIALLHNNEGVSMTNALKFLRKEIEKSKIEEGTVVRFNRTLSAEYDYMRREMSQVEDGKVLTYAAVFVNDRWYLTGKGSLGNEALTNRDFVDRLSRSDISDIEVATAFEAL